MRLTSNGMMMREDLRGISQREIAPMAMNFVESEEDEPVEVDIQFKFGAFNMMA